MQRIPDRLPNYDHDYDGRPPVEYDGYDPLLAALIREHGDRYHLEVARAVAVKREAALRELAKR